MDIPDNIEPICVKSAVDLLIDRLTQAIIDGTFKSGERIPTEDKLAASFGVGRNTVREAVKTLVAYGILEVRRPNGTFVCDSFNPKGINPLLYGMILQKDEAYQELIDLRKVIETGIFLHLAEKKIQPEEKKHLYELTKELEQAILKTPYDVEEIIRKDISFHNEIANLSHNKLLILENEMITRLTYSSRLKTIQKVMSKGEKEYLIRTHYDLVSKLESNDIEALYQAVQNSYFYWKDAYR